MRSIVGTVVGGLVGLVVAYAIAALHGTGEPWFVLLLPVGMILGWRVTAAYGTVRRCPNCAEEVRVGALLCPHCGTDLIVPV